MRDVIRVFFLFVIVLSFGLVACDEFLEVSVARSEITKQKVFEDDVTASSAIVGIYSDMYTSLSSFASGSYSSVTGLCAVSAGELEYFCNDLEYDSFESYKINSSNSNVNGLWRSMYYSVYSANSALEGLGMSLSITDSVKRQLTGEALFIRAFSYFYLVNLFGPVPVVTTTDYKLNSRLSRSDGNSVYSQVVSDLIRARELLSDNYPTAERIRPNRAAADALLARVYLYLEEWENAELSASRVIDRSDYALASDVNGVFLKDSKEAIWQLRPSVLSFNTNEGITFILSWSPALNPASPFGMTPELLHKFDNGDLRKLGWIDSLVVGDEVFYYPFKYKKNYGDLYEYSMVIRLAEVYFIRAEALAHREDLERSVTDINQVRLRAGLSVIDSDGAGITLDSILSIIEVEREKELFTEWGHRWLDLKRTGKADQTLAERPGYSPLYKLYPVPQEEFNKNPFLGKQNDGY